MKKVALFLAHGTEEGEALIELDLLRRANIEVTTFSIEGDLEILSAHNVSLKADDLIENISLNDFDLLFVPGGAKGVERMYENQLLSDALTEYAKSNGFLSAVCAGPTVLGKLGLLQGEKATCATGWDNGLINSEYLAEPVVVSNNIITGQGLGASIPLALKNIELLLDRTAAEKVAEAICYWYEW